ncbi:hypothetical protein HPB48_012377 [Haemaphysalis longicornis]|uniref:Uncharacterized protein n=1 Tax=Haemaphysalis longicornis TaxID=44386 RepID=A0A9J6G1W3_HAELO|nr:hypothetical protein HPB48_012377 [Haemaphysalis longicornis]
MTSETGAAPHGPLPGSSTGQPPGTLPAATGLLPATVPSVPALPVNFSATASSTPVIIENAPEPALDPSNTASVPIPAGQASHVSADSPASHPLPDGDDAFSDISDTSAATVMSTEEAHGTAEASSGYQLVLPRKRRLESKNLQCTEDGHSAIQPPKHGLTVIFKPIKEAQIITKFNPLAMKDGLESMAPEGVLQVCPNHRLNLLAVDTRNIDSTKCLLKVTSIAGIPVKAYEPRPT